MVFFLRGGKKKEEGRRWKKRIVVVLIYRSLLCSPPASSQPRLPTSSLTRSSSLYLSLSPSLSRSIRSVFLFFLFRL